MGLIKQKFAKTLKFLSERRILQISAYVAGILVVIGLAYLGVFSYLKVKDQSGPPPSNAPWPMFMRDAQHTGKSPNNGPDTNAERWVRRDYLGNNNNSAALDATGSKLYATMGKFLHEINTNESDNLKDHALEASAKIVTTPAISSDGIYFGTADNKLYAVNSSNMTQNMTQKWVFNTNGTLCTDNVRCPSPTIGPDGAIYFATDSYFYALWDFGQNDVRVKWEIPINDSGLELVNANVNSPVIDQSGNIYYTFDAQYFDDLSSSPPVTKIYSFVFKMSTNSGNLAWSRPRRFGVDIADSNSSISGPAMDSAGNIYFGHYNISPNPDASFYKLSAGNNILWQKDMSGFQFWNPPAIDGDRVYFTTWDTNTTPNYARLYGVRSDNGNDFAVLKDVPIGFYTSPIIDSDQAIYIGNYLAGSYRLTKFTYTEGGGFNELWNYQIGATADDKPRTPIISEPGLTEESTLYVPLYGQRVIAIGPKQVFLDTQKLVEPTEVNLGDDATVTIRIDGKGTPPRIPNDIILVMDKTGSMNDLWGGETKLNAAKAALKSFVETVAGDSFNRSSTNKDRLALVIYSSEQSGLVQPLTDDYEVVKRAIRGISAAGGSTPIGSGLGLANEELATNGRPVSLAGKYIILATDGLQNEDPAVDQKGPYPDSCILKRTIDNNYRTYTVGIGNDVNSTNGVMPVVPSCDWITSRPASATLFPGTCSWDDVCYHHYNFCYLLCQGGAKCNDKDYYFPRYITEKGSCLLRRIANYTGAGTGYYYAGDPGALLNIYNSLAVLIPRKIVESPNTIVKERLNSGMEFKEVTDVKYYNATDGILKEYNTEEEISTFGILTKLSNGFDYQIKQPIYVNDYIEISFKIRANPPAPGTLPIDASDAILRYKHYRTNEWVETPIKQAYLRVLGGFNVEGDVHTANGINIEGSASGIVTAGGTIASFFSSDLVKIAPYILDANSDANWSNAVAINQNSLKRLKNERAINFNNLSEINNLSSGVFEKSAEGGVWRYDGGVLNIDSSIAFSGRGTIIVTSGNLNIMQNVTTSGLADAVGFIVENGSVTIGTNVTDLQAAIFAPNGQITIQNGPTAIILGLLVAQSITVSRENVSVIYNPRISGAIDFAQATFHPALPGFSQITAPTWQEKTP